VKQVATQDSASQPLKTVVEKFLTVILALFSSLTKRYTEWPY